MAIYHIVLFKLIQNPGPTQDQLAAFRTAAENMVGKVPGLQRIDIGPPHAISAMRAQGFDMGLVAVLDKAETIKVYAEHPEHLKVHKFREAIATDTLAFDLEYTP